MAGAIVKAYVILFIDEMNLSLTCLMYEVMTSADDDELLLDDEVDKKCKRCRNFVLAKFDKPSLPIDDVDRLGCMRVYLRSKYCIYSSNSCSSSTVGGGGEGVEVVVDGRREDT